MSSFIGILAPALLLATSIQAGAQTVTVADDVVITLERTSCYGECPVYTVTIDALRQLERQIDEATRTKRWIRLDVQMLDELVRDGWSPTPMEQSEFLRKALEYDELAVVNGVIDVGADPNGTYFGTNTPPLMMVQSAGAARLLREGREGHGTCQWQAVRALLVSA